ncbi:hypothetical protein BDK51DRAFT_27133 [Blyttiomyces helicus]|uniref:DDT domain-containing protein n=1 Tax=Blyttiomyces helicus TaxID=388810 RepID=A0A4P9WBT8_9FUNG|nr:hypothetical protein BDK51DRAFT_27133 [Blyttiomyces helicus]|eukprot:RKO89954.1 hypothetical protein BDK51DRAFT_27133 [Blyttiomyces helicus]
MGTPANPLRNYRDMEEDESGPAVLIVPDDPDPNPPPPPPTPASGKSASKSKGSGKKPAKAAKGDDPRQPKISLFATRMASVEPPASSSSAGNANKKTEGGEDSTSPEISNINSIASSSAAGSDGPTSAADSPHDSPIVSHTKSLKKPDPAAPNFKQTRLHFPPASASPLGAYPPDAPAPLRPATLIKRHAQALQRYTKLPTARSVPVGDGLPLDAWRILTIDEAMVLMTVVQFLQSFGKDLLGIRGTSYGFDKLEQAIYTPDAYPLLLQVYTNMYRLVDEDDPCPEWMTQVRLAEHFSETEPADAALPKAFRTIELPLIPPPLHVRALATLMESVTDTATFRAHLDATETRMSDMRREKWARIGRRKDLETDRRHSEEALVPLDGAYHVAARSATPDPDLLQQLATKREEVRARLAAQKAEIKALDELDVAHYPAYEMLAEKSRGQRRMLLGHDRDGRAYWWWQMQEKLPEFHLGADVAKGSKRKQSVKEDAKGEESEDGREMDDGKDEGRDGDNDEAGADSDAMDLYSDEICVPDGEGGVTEMYGIIVEDVLLHSSCLGSMRYSASRKEAPDGGSHAAGTAHSDAAGDDDGAVASADAADVSGTSDIVPALTPATVPAVAATLESDLDSAAPPVTPTPTPAGSDTEIEVDAYPAVAASDADAPLPAVQESSAQPGSPAGSADSEEEEEEDGFKSDVAEASSSIGSPVLDDDDERPQPTVKTGESTDPVKAEGTDSTDPAAPPPPPPPLSAPASPRNPTADPAPTSSAPASPTIPTPAETPSLPTRWRYIDSLPALTSLFRALNPKGLRERELRSAIEHRIHLLGVFLPDCAAKISATSRARSRALHRDQRVDEAMECFGEWVRSRGSPLPHNDAVPPAWEEMALDGAGEAFSELEVEVRAGFGRAWRGAAWRGADGLGVDTTRGVNAARLSGAIRGAVEGWGVRGRDLLTAQHVDRIAMLEGATLSACCGWLFDAVDIVRPGSADFAPAELGKTSAAVTTIAAKSSRGVGRPTSRRSTGSAPPSPPPQPSAPAPVAPKPHRKQHPTPTPAPADPPQPEVEVVTKTRSGRVSSRRVMQHASSSSSSASSAPPARPKSARAAARAATVSTDDDHPPPPTPPLAPPSIKLIITAAHLDGAARWSKKSVSKPGSDAEMEDEDDAEGSVGSSGRGKRKGGADPDFKGEGRQKRRKTG